jgi:hypothetical protein
VDPPRETIPPLGLAAAARLYLRYALPLTALSAIACAPVILVALRTPTPLDRAGINAIIARGWLMLALGWLCQLALVGAATPIARHPLPQLPAFTAGLARLVRAIIPCLAAAVAILLGSLALVVPGVLLLGLLVFTGASDARGLPTPLVDSLGFARRHLAATARAAGALFVLDVAIAVLAQIAFANPSKLTDPALLRAVPYFTHAIAAALVLLSPLPATLLAILRTSQPAASQQPAANRQPAASSEQPTSST